MMQVPKELDLIIGSFHVANADHEPGRYPVEVALVHYFEFALFIKDVKCVRSANETEIILEIPNKGQVVYQMDDEGVKLHQQFKEAVTAGLRDMIRIKVVTLTFKGEKINGKSQG